MQGKRGRWWWRGVFGGEGGREGGRKSSLQESKKCVRRNNVAVKISFSALKFKLHKSCLKHLRVVI